MRALTVSLFIGVGFAHMGCGGCVPPSNEGEGEAGDEGEGEGGEGEGEGDEGEGEGAEGEGEGEGEGEATREFACGSGGVIESVASCSDDDDCTIQTVQINCCGTDRITGVTVNIAAEFSAVADACDEDWPRCGCAEFPAVADDGTQDDFEEPVTVRCLEGLCVTSYGGNDRAFTCADENDPVETEASCNDATECVAVSVLADCCGSIAVTGVRAEFASTFNDDAANCFEAICDCAPQPSVADDGNVQSGDTEVSVDCVNALCTTSFAGDR